MRVASWKLHLKSQIFKRKPAEWIFYGSARPPRLDFTSMRGPSRLMTDIRRGRRGNPRLYGKSF
jgi:hypothetical protein